MNEQIASTLGAIDPRLGAMYDKSTEEINNVLSDIGAANKDAVARYLRASTNRLVSTPTAKRAAAGVGDGRPPGCSSGWNGTS